jgi:hypothetical protein
MTNRLTNELLLIDAKSTNKIKSSMKDNGSLGTDDEASLTELFSNCHNQEQLIMFSSLVRRFLKDANLKRKMFKKVIEKSSLLEIPGITFKNDLQLKNITIISANVPPESEHLKAISIYALSIIMVDKVEKLNIIFTSEMVWDFYGKDIRKKRESLYLEIIKGYIEQFTNNLLGEEHLMSKIEIFFSPRCTEMPNIIGDCILRFEGSAIFNSTHIWGQTLVNNRPVVTALFNTAVGIGANSHVTLLQNKKTEVNQQYYLPHSRISFDDVSSIKELIENSNTVKINLVTIYSVDRISKGLLQLCQDDWNKIEVLLNKNIQLNWFFIGASDVEYCKTLFPKSLQAFLGSQIHILPPGNLDEFMTFGNIFVALPKTTGGGGTCRNSVKSGMLVYGENNNRSDITNYLPSEFIYDKFTDALEEINFILADSELYKNKLSQLLKHFHRESDAKAKGRELYSIFENTTRRFVGGY